MSASGLDTIAERAARADGLEKRRYVRGIFSEIAPSYDLLNHLLSMNIDKGWRRKAIAALQWPREPRGAYLDLCAGTLDVARQLAREPGFQGRVFAADFAEPMLRAGRAKIGGACIVPAVADALELPVRDASLAGAIVAFGIRNVSDLDAALRETHRVLAPGARFVILEFSRPRNAAVRHFYNFYFHRILPLVGGAVSGHPTAYRYLPASVERFPVEEELARRMTAAGFRDVRWTSLTMGIAAIHSGIRA